MEAQKLQGNTDANRPMAESLIAGPLAYTMPVTFLLVLGIYILSMPHDLTWSYFGGDGGELITASVTLGIPHPPGYPTYVLLGKLFSFLPFGTLASRYHLLSAIAMSVAAAFVSRIVLDHQVRHEVVAGRKGQEIFFAALAAGLIFAFQPLVWSQAVIAEVYALNLAFLGGLMWVLLSGRNPLLAGLLFGLCITTHVTSLLFFPLCLFLLGKRQFSGFVIGFFFGLIPLLALFMFARGTSPIIWGQPDNISDWLWLVSGRLYLPNVFNIAQINLGARFTKWLPLLLPPLALLAISLRSLMARKYWLSIRRLVFVMLLVISLYLLYALGYSTSDAAVLLLPGLLLMAVLIGFGINWSGRYALLLALGMFIVGGWFLTKNVMPPLRSSFEKTLSQIPAGAIVLTPGDPTVAATWYFAYAEEQRVDVIVVDDNMFQFSWYRDHLAGMYPKLQHLDEDDLPHFILANSQQYVICRLSMYEESLLNCEKPER